MFTFDLARELDPATVTANCLHPATYMATTMVRQSGVTPISTVEEGAEAILNLAVAEELDGRSGQFRILNAANAELSRHARGFRYKQSQTTP
jgi:NAD(P)-dependent dehydrogenase (short-subunit alcohol dehydrogenase family)